MIIDIGYKLQVIYISNLMGGCLNQKHIDKMIDIPTEFQIDQQSQGVVTKLLQRTLFNLLRKANEIQIISNNQQNNRIFNQQVRPNFENLQPKDFKALYSFKTLLTVGQFQESIQRIKEFSSPKTIYSVSSDTARKFVSKYPIFKYGHSYIEPKQIPIYVINSKDIKKFGPQKRIFLHSNANPSSKIYSKLQLSSVMIDKTSNSVQQAVQQLLDCEQETILFLHSKQRKKQDLFKIFKLYLQKLFNLNQLNVISYLSLVIPHGKLAENQTNFLANSFYSPRKQDKVVKKAQLSITQTYQMHFKNLFNQMGGSKEAKNKLYRSYNLLITLVSNIYNNKGEQNYRKIRKTNSQINDLLGKYQNGVKLLKQVGFTESGGGYLNQVDIKYLKIYRTDLDMAYKNFISETKG